MVSLYAIVTNRIHIENCCLARFFSPVLTSQFALYNKISHTLGIYSCDEKGDVTVNNVYQLKNGDEIQGTVHSMA